MTMVPQQEQAKQKEALRLFWKKKRADIPAHRKKEAFESAYNAISRISKRHHYVLSYASFGEEFDTKKINKQLAHNRKLLLPKVNKNQLKIYHVTEPARQLSVNSWGIPEPIPSICQEVKFHIISCILVPGLVFDSRNHRIGYGKGFYDRFLSSLPPTAQSFGLGFKEQYHCDSLPTTQLDFPLTNLLLF